MGYMTSIKPSLTEVPSYATNLHLLIRWSKRNTMITFASKAGSSVTLYVCKKKCMEVFGGGIWHWRIGSICCLMHPVSVYFLNVSLQSFPNLNKVVAQMKPNLDHRDGRSENVHAVCFWSCHMGHFEMHWQMAGFIVLDFKYNGCGCSWAQVWGSGDCECTQPGQWRNIL